MSTFSGGWSSLLKGNTPFCWVLPGLICSKQPSRVVSVGNCRSGVTFDLSNLRLYSRVFVWQADPLDVPKKVKDDNMPRRISYTVPTKLGLVKLDVDENFQRQLLQDSRPF